MKILVINCGSSSLKYQLINMEDESVICKGICERIGLDGRIEHKLANGDKIKKEIAMPDHAVATGIVIDYLTDKEFGCIADMSEIEAVGHRVVHGGTYFSESVLVNDDVIAKLAAFLDNNGDIGMASPEIRFPDGRLQVLGKRNPCPAYLIASRMRSENPGKLLRKYAMLDCDLSKPIDIENATGCFMFIRTELFKKIGGFDKRYFMYFEDSDLTRAVNRNSRTVYYPGATVYHE
mgnify:CR=1 FL=1